MVAVARRHLRGVASWRPPRRTRTRRSPRRNRSLVGCAHRPPPWNGAPPPSPPHARRVRRRQRRASGRESQAPRPRSWRRRTRAKEKRTKKRTSKAKIPTTTTTTTTTTTMRRRWPLRCCCRCWHRCWHRCWPRLGEGGRCSALGRSAPRFRGARAARGRRCSTPGAPARCTRAHRRLGIGKAHARGQTDAEAVSFRWPWRVCMRLHFSERLTDGPTD